MSTEAIGADLVQAFVGNAHGNLETVQELLEQQPGLLNAAWDWGGGDWETALGAAAHMGRRDIATYLLERGARLDIFAAAMLGEIEIVQAIVTAFPGMVTACGPHGIPLIEHARAGGLRAEPVLRFLVSAEAQPSPS